MRHRSAGHRARPALVAEPFAIAPVACGVEVLEREPEWIDLGMAAGTLWQLAVNLQSLPDRRLVDAGTLGAISPALATGSPGSVFSSVFKIQVPRFTGEVRVPFDVIVRIEAWVTMPPR